MIKLQPGDALWVIYGTGQSAPDSVVEIAQCVEEQQNVHHYLLIWSKSGLIRELLHVFAVVTRQHFGPVLADTYGEPALASDSLATVVHTAQG